MINDHGLVVIKPLGIIYVGKHGKFQAISPINQLQLRPDKPSSLFLNILYAPIATNLFFFNLGPTMTL